MSLLPGATDRLFLRFCRRGDTDALAQVFDRVAPELLRVAVYLIGNRADAEDLLQRTFLAAIESRSAYDPRRRAMPWLLGILANHVKRVLRERGRRLGEGVLPAAAVRDPAIEAADRELEANVVRLRDELGTPYREVLELHLEQGLNAKEIAARLGRPAGTVRTQLVRALEMLRRRLPSGFVAAVVPFAPQVAVLAKVKGAVMAAAKVAAPVAAAAGVGMGVVSAVTGGVLVGKKILVVVPLLALALGVGVYVALPEQPAAAHGSAEATPQPVAAETTTPIAAQSQSGPGAAPNDRREIVSTPTTTTGTAVIRGRCVDEQGNPLAGCRVRLDGSTATQLDARGLQSWRDQRGTDIPLAPFATTTGSDGRFEFHFTPPPTCRYQLRAAHDDFVGCAAKWRHIPEHADITLPDAVLRRGTRLRGVVVDELGRPVPGVFLSMDPEPQLAADGAWVADRHLGQRTGIDGRFAQKYPVAPGDYHATVIEHTVSAPEIVAVRGDPPDLDVRIVLQLGAAAGEIQGTVADETGRLLDGVMLYSVPEGAFACSVQDGSFRMVRGSTMPGTPIQLRVGSDAADAEVTPLAYAWGSEGVGIVLHGGLDVELCVHGSDGTPVNDFSIAMYTLDSRNWSQHQDRFRNCAEGRARVRGVRRGQWQLMVIPEDAVLDTSAYQTFDVGDATPNRVDVVVPRRGSRQLQLRTPAGRPVADSAVRLLDPAGNEPGLDWHMLPPMEWHHTTDPRKVLLLQEATTDADGKAQLRGPVDRPLDLALLGPGHVPVIVRGVRFDDAALLEVTVAVGATVVGRARPAGIREELLRLANCTEQLAHDPTATGFRVAMADGTIFPARQEPPALLQPDGTFRLDGVPPGRGQLKLQYSWSYGSSRVTGPMETVATLDLRDGETTRVAADLSSFVTGGLEAQVLHDGRPLADETITVEREGAGGGLGIRTDGDGHLQLRDRSGSYRFSWSRRGLPLVRSDTEVVITPGEVTTARIVFATGSVRLRVLTAEGTPVPGLRLRALRNGDKFPCVLPASDAEGQAESELGPGGWSIAVLPKRLLDPAAMTTFYEEHRGDPGSLEREYLAAGQFTVTAGATTEATVHLPAAWSQ